MPQGQCTVVGIATHISSE